MKWCQEIHSIHLFAFVESESEVQRHIESISYTIHVQAKVTVTRSSHEGCGSTKIERHELSFVGIYNQAPVDRWDGPLMAFPSLANSA